MTLATAQWPTRYEGLLAIRDAKSAMAERSGLARETVSRLIEKAHDDFHSSIAGEMARRNR